MRKVCVCQEILFFKLPQIPVFSLQNASADIRGGILFHNYLFFRFLTIPNPAALAARAKIHPAIGA